MEQYYLNINEIYIPEKDAVISTLLGSCVSVCLWDKDLKIGAMNHVMLPESKKNGKNNIGIEESIKIMYRMLVKRGSQHESMVAKVFGGSSLFPLNPMFNVGIKNSTAAFKCLNDLNIPVIAFDVNGSKPRQVRFNTATGQVLRKFISTRKYSVPEKKSICS